MRLIPFVERNYNLVELGPKGTGKSCRRINLGRGLDIFQFVPNDAFDLAVRLQQYRKVKAFGVTYIRETVSSGGYRATGILV